MYRKTDARGFCIIRPEEAGEVVNICKSSSLPLSSSSRRDCSSSMARATKKFSHRHRCLSWYGASK